MSTADIYKQYLSDYEDAAKRYNRNANAYQNSLVLQGGPVRAKDSNTGQEYGLYSTPDGGRNIVQRGTREEYGKAVEGKENFGSFVPDTQADFWSGQQASNTGTWTTREGQNPSAIRSFGGWQGGEGYYSDLGNGVAAMRAGGKGTGKYVTERISGDEYQARQMAESGRYKDVKLVNGGANENGDPISYIDVTYEEMAFPDKPGEFNKKQPSLSIAQYREMQNPTPTISDIERESDGGIINSVRSQFAATSPAAGLIQRFR